MEKAVEDHFADLTEDSSGLSKLHLSDIAPLQTEQRCRKAAGMCECLESEQKKLAHMHVH